MNYHSVLSKVFLLLVFIALGCSQQKCSCKRMETIKQEIVITNSLGVKPTERYPNDLVALLKLKYVDTLSPAFAPSTDLKRLDDALVVEDLQKQGLPFFKKMMRSVFPKGVDQYDADIDSLFSKNTIGDKLIKQTKQADSLKVMAVNKYILELLNGTQKVRFYFFSNNSPATQYCCNYAVGDTSKMGKKADTAKGKIQQKKTKGKGFGCASETGSKKKKVEKRTSIDTIFPVYHNMDSLNYLIARDADSLGKKKSGCSVKDQTVKFIVFYNPPESKCSFKDDTIRVIPQTDTARICFEGTGKASINIGQFQTNFVPDSVFWELTSLPEGIIMEPTSGKGDSTVVKFSRKNLTLVGDLFLKVTPFKDSLKSKPGEYVYRFTNKCVIDSVVPCKYKLSNKMSLIRFDKELQAKSDPVRISLIPRDAQSITWEYISCTKGLTVRMPEGVMKATSPEIPSFEVTRTDQTLKGYITFRITPAKSGCPKIKPLEFNFLATAIPPPADCPQDTATVNAKRRTIISEFRNRLFMYFNSKKDEDREYFRKDAVNKINEIPDVQIEILPKNSIEVIFNSSWSTAKVSPIYETRGTNKCYIIGISISR